MRIRLSGRLPYAVALVLLVAAVVVPAPARANVDCAQCRAVCSKTAKAYPEELKEAAGAAVKHKSKEAEQAFNEAKATDPAFGGHDVHASIKSYKRAVILDGDNSIYRNHLAGALMTAGLVDEAIYNLEAATKLVPAEGKFLVNLGYAHHRAGDETKAMLYYMRALNLDPRDVRARLYLGFALDLLGYRDEAILEFQKVLVQDATNPDARRALDRITGKPPPPPAKVDIVPSSAPVSKGTPNPPPPLLPEKAEKQAYCQTDAECAAGQQCKDRGDKVKVCVAKGAK